MTVLLFAGRNLRLFFRDKAAVFYSLLSVFIIVGLYAIFLGDMMAGSIAALGYDAREIVDSWITAGLLSVSAITAAMGALGIMVDDRSKKILKDFASSPITRTQLVAGYIFSAFLIGVIMCLITLALAEAYIVANGGSLLSLGGMMRTLGVLLLSVLAGSSIVFLLVSFFKSSNAFGAASSILGTLIGFFNGIYIPIGSLPEAVQSVIKAFPMAHSALLFRRVIMEQPMAEAFAGAPPGFAEGFMQMFGSAFKYGDTVAPASLSVWVLVLTAAVFFALGALNMSRKDL